MRRSLLALALLLPLAACDSGRESRAYDLSFLDTRGAFVARIQFDEPEPLACDALDCNAADWRLVEGEAQNEVTLGLTRGTLRAAPIEDGWSVRLHDDLADGGTEAAFRVDGGRVEGTWTKQTIAGPLPGGTVEGTVEGTVR